MRAEKLISFTWRCYSGEMDFEAKLSFWSTLICTKDKFEVHAIAGVQCVDVSFSDGRKYQSWSAKSQLCDQIGSVFRAMWHHDIFDLRDTLDAYASQRYGPEMYLADSVCVNSAPY